MVVLLCSWLKFAKVGDQWDLIEYFAGKGRISTLGAKMGLRVASFEILHESEVPYRRRRFKPFPRRRPMDMNGEAGFAFLGERKACLSNKR